jgi:hypothetical protein
MNINVAFGRAIMLATLLASASGCVGTKILVPNSRLASNTAGVLGVSPDAITITDRRGAGTNTYYVAHVANRVYACTVNGGNLMTLGMVNPPTCNPIPPKD